VLGISIVGTPSREDAEALVRRVLTSIIQTSPSPGVIR
jgi:hypothetical protein